MLELAHNISNDKPFCDALKFFTEDILGGNTHSYCQMPFLLYIRLVERFLDENCIKKDYFETILIEKISHYPHLVRFNPDKVHLFNIIRSYMYGTNLLFCNFNWSDTSQGFYFWLNASNEFSFYIRKYSRKILKCQHLL